MPYRGLEHHYHLDRASSRGEETLELHHRELTKGVDSWMRRLGETSEGVSCVLPVSNHELQAIIA